VIDPARILIVEDDAILATHLEDMLIQLGYQVVGMAATGAAAVASALAQQPDAILMDIRLRGEMTGLQVAEELHKQNSFPIIYLTAYTDDMLLDQAKITEAYAYLAKPVRPRELRASLEMALYKHHTEQRLQQLNQVLRAVRDVNQLITREHDAGRLRTEACKILLQARGYRYVSISRAGDGRLQPVARAGDDQGFIEQVRASATRTQAEALPGAEALRERRPVVCRDIAHEERFAPWRAEAAKAGFRSAAAIPMLNDAAVHGVLCVFADRADRFDAEEMDLLAELAGDLAFGLSALEGEARRREAESRREAALTALAASEERFRAITAQLSDMVFLTSSRGYITYISDASQALFGYAPEEMIGQMFTTFLAESDIAKAMAAFAADVTLGFSSQNLELRMRRKDGSRFYGEVNASRFSVDGEGGTLGTIRDITERRQAQQVITQHEQELRMILQTALDGYWLLDTEGRFVEVNNAYCAMSGYSRDELLHMYIADVEAIETEQAALAHIQKTVRYGSDRFESRHWRKDGRIMDVEMSVNYLPLGAGRVVCFCRDITERKQMEIALRQSEDKFAKVFRTSPDAICINRLSDGMYVEVNDGFCAFSGYSAAEACGKTSFELEIWADLADRERLVRALHKQGALTNAEASFRLKDGAVRVGLMSARIVEIDGEPCILSVTRDIHERKQMEAALRDKVAALETLYGIGQAIGLVGTANHTFDSVVARAVAEICGLWAGSVASFLFVDEAAQALRPHAASEGIPRNKMSGFEIPLDHGITGWVARHRRPVCVGNADQDPRYVPAVPGMHSEMAVPLLVGGRAIGVIDVECSTPDAYSQADLSVLTTLASQLATAYERSRLDAELTHHAATLQQMVAERTAELRVAETKYRTLVEQTPAVTYTFELEAPNRVLYVSPQIEVLTGFAPARWLNEPGLWLSRVHPDDRETTLAALTHIAETGGRLSNEYRMFAEDGRLLWIRAEGRVLRDDAGRPSCVQGVMLDITERKEAEEAMRSALQHEKELGELKSRFISMTSHEFRTPLTTILSSAALLARHGDRLAAEKQEAALRRIRSAAENMTRLLEDVLMIGRAEAGRLEFGPATLDLATFCSDLMEEMRLTAAPGHVLRFVQEGCCSDAFVDERLLRQIVSNLLSNAIKYSPDGGAVQLRLKCQDGWATLEVQDEGIGIPEEAQSRLFETFHRASNVGGIPGTGLGLPIVQKAVEMHGGTIRVISQMGNGTTVVIKLPIQKPAGPSMSQEKSDG
jgi:PAS domain S-box-containing protein